MASRSAQLVAAAIIGILKHIEHHNPPPETRSTSPRNIVAVDGGVFANFRLYRDLLCQSIKEIAGKRILDQYCFPASFARQYAQIQGIVLYLFPRYELHFTCIETVACEEVLFDFGASKFQSKEFELNCALYAEGQLSESNGCF